MIALLAVIAAGVIFIAADNRAPSGHTTFAPTTATQTAMVQTPNPVPPPPNQAVNVNPMTPPAPTPPKEDRPATKISFAQASHDFGKIMQDSDNHYTFTFTNTGNEPLLITKAEGSCGCTVPEYPKHPIAPGETGELRVQYQPGKQEGRQNKTVTVTANTEPAQTVLNIMADVQKSI